MPEQGQPTDSELAAVDEKLQSRGWINLLDHAGLTYRERQVIGWALRRAPRFRETLSELEEFLDNQADVDNGRPNDAMRHLTEVRAAIAKACAK